MNNKELTELKKFIDGRIEFLFDHWVEHDKPPYTFGGWREEVVNDIANKLTSLNDEIKREVAIDCMRIVAEEDGGGEIKFVKTLGDRIRDRIAKKFLTQKENNE